MAFFDVFDRKKRLAEAEVEEAAKKSASLFEEYNAKQEMFANYNYTPIFTYSFDGEKTPGEIGIVKNYVVDYAALRARSWQSYIESEVTQTVINRFITWIIGSGLKLQSEPIKEILDANGINIDSESFSKMNEAKFNKIFSKINDTDYSKVNNLNKIAHEVKKNALLGGDCLVILRLKKGRLNVQMIDGSSVQNPFFNSSELKADIKKGNKISNGIVTNKRGEHVAFYVKMDERTFKRVKAKTSRGFYEQAFMVYGLKYRNSHNRGIPLISTSLETLKKLDRYREASVGSAEERAKIPYFISHGSNSTGENPLAKSAAASLGLKNENQKLQEDPSQTVNKIAATTQKQVFNLPIDSSITALDSRNELNFGEFYSVNIDMVCASLGIPPDVAKSKYDSNFSASRAALKDWEHTINVEREDFSRQFYQKIYSFWLGNEIISGRVKAEGYFQALLDGDIEIISAYENARFIGSNVPHIDPAKEVTAERLKLGDLGKHLPLTTAEQATEALNGGDYDVNQKQFTQEVDEFELNQQPPSNSNNSNDDEKKDD